MDHSHYTAPLQRQLDKLTAALANGQVTNSLTLLQQMRANLNGAEDCLIRELLGQRAIGGNARLATS